MIIVNSHTSSTPAIPPPSFRSGVVWNMASFVLMGVSGVLLNIIIAKAYPAAVLGVFNQVFALYIFASQLAVFGVHYSVLHHASVLVDKDPRTAGHASWSALVLVAAMSLLVCIGIGFSHTLLGAQLLHSPGVAHGILWVLPALFLFPLNKVLLAVLNSHRRMRAYAIGNGSRYLLIIFAVGLMAALGLPGEQLAGAFSVAEAGLFVGLFWATNHQLGRPDRAAFDHWCGNHLAFGRKGMVAGLLAELNTRIDVLVLGYFMSDASVGVYSFVAILAEGILQLLTVLRANYDPLLARLYADQDWEGLKQTIARGRRWTYLGMAGVGIASILLYPWVMDWLGFSAAYLEASPVFSILLLGIMLSAGYLPFGGLLQQAGFPGSQSLLIFGVSLLNLLGNILLVPPLGMLGSAIATASAQTAFAVLWIILVRRKLGVRL